MQKFERFIIYPLLIVALFYAVTGGAGTDILANPFEIEDTIRTREVEIYNYNDKKIGSFGGVGGTGKLELLNNFGNKIVYLGANVTEDGIISVSNKDGDRVNDITTTDDGKAGSFLMSNSRGDELIYLGTSTTGIGLIQMYNNRGDKLIFLGSNTDDHGLINIYDKYGDDFKSYSFR